MMREDVHGTWNSGGWFVVRRPGSDGTDRGLYEGPDLETAREVADWWERRYGTRPTTEEQ